jgi:hypothetical protein
MIIGQKRLRTQGPRLKGGHGAQHCTVRHVT